MSLSSNGKKREISDAARKRKEHSARILLEKRSEKIESTADKEFLCTQKFENHLPHVPSGPYFKAICLPHSSTDFAGYSTSTLEKNYVWQPHHGVDAGLRIDLVDSERILGGMDKTVSASDAKYLADRRSATAVDERIPWLKRTTYSTNDLYDNVNKFKGTEELQKGFKDRKLQGIGVNSDPFDIGHVQYAFDVVSNKSKQPVAKAGKRIVWSMPVLPDSEDMWGQNLSLITFGEGTIIQDAQNLDDTGSNAESYAEKRRRLSRSVMCNIRDIAVRSSTSKAESTISQQLYAASMTVPVETTGVSKEYEWVRDLRMDIRNQHLQDHFEFTVRESDGMCTYCPLRSRIEMKKIDMKYSQPQSITLQRREKFPSEVEASNILCEDIGESKDNLH